MDLKGTFKGLRVLVTGDTGFKGSWLCEWLLVEGAEVYGLGLEPNTEPALFEQLCLADRIHHRELDVRDATAVRDHVGQVAPDIVFHLAAQALVRFSYEEPVATYATNVMGTVHVLEAVRVHAQRTGRKIAALIVTTDKCYANKEWLHSYREADPMGGHDPYSSSKGACELAIQSYRSSYFKDPLASGVALASARAGNVIGGGDWAADRILPDCLRALRAGQMIEVRNPQATRPWQHVLEPLSGYLLLAAELWRGLNRGSALQTRFPLPDLSAGFNFGPGLQANRTVGDLVEEVLKHWPGQWRNQSDSDAPHEASLLNLATDKAHHILGWSSRWDFEVAVAATVNWYREVAADPDLAPGLTLKQIHNYCSPVPG